MKPNTFTSTSFDTPLGPMIAVADKTALHRLEFADCSTALKTVSGSCLPLLSIQEELNLYYAGRLKEFQTPIAMAGTPFQRRVWEELRQIAYGQTISYSEQAARMGHPTAVRAVALANSANRFAILIPCHRVIRANGNLSGYAAGVHRKEWLLKHEADSLQERTNVS